MVKVPKLKLLFNDKLTPFIAVRRIKFGEHLKTNLNICRKIFDTLKSAFQSICITNNRSVWALFNMKQSFMGNFTRSHHSGYCTKNPMSSNKDEIRVAWSGLVTKAIIFETWNIEAKRLSTTELNASSCRFFLQSILFFVTKHRIWLPGNTGSSIDELVGRGAVPAN